MTKSPGTSRGHKWATPALAGVAAVVVVIVLTVLLWPGGTDDAGSAPDLAEVAAGVFGDSSVQYSGDQDTLVVTVRDPASQGYVEVLTLLDELGFSGATIRRMTTPQANADPREAESAQVTVTWESNAVSGFEFVFETKG